MIRATCSATPITVPLLLAPFAYGQVPSTPDAQRLDQLIAEMVEARARGNDCTVLAPTSTSIASIPPPPR